MFVIFFVTILGLFVAEVVTDYHPGKLGGLLFVVFWFPLLVIHECGHAVVGRMFGCSVHRLVVGFGRPLWIFSIRGVLVEIRSFPIEGFVTFSEPARRLSRGKRALTYFAGPGAELLLLALIAVGVGPSTLLTKTTSTAMVALQSFCVCIVVGVSFNLIPHRVQSSHRGDAESTPNDGLGILLSLFGDTDDAS
jgi:membrane-associated protease RseP (regulator of RpoE activity)